MITVKSICNLIEDFAPLRLQESYDNCGLLIGNAQDEVHGVLTSIDITEAVIDEAISKNCNLIISHHPLIFNGLYRINDENLVQRCVKKAIKNDIAIYTAHTNIDSVINGVSGKMAEKIGLINIKVLHEKIDSLVKLVTFVPKLHAYSVREAMFDAGAGKIGNYDACSYNVDGTATFRANNDAMPFVGNLNEIHSEAEIRIEVILPSHLQSSVIDSLIKTHPYEEPAYDLIPLNNGLKNIGLGIVGELEMPEDELNFLQRIKQIFGLTVIRHTKFSGKKIHKVALCGGAGSSFISNAIAANADVYISGDFKYHEFFEAENKLIIADIGHFESEQFTKDIFYEIIRKKMPTFAVQISEIRTNPINYL